MSDAMGLASRLLACLCCMRADTGSGTEAVDECNPIDSEHWSSGQSEDGDNAGYCLLIRGGCKGLGVPILLLALPMTLAPRPLAELSARAVSTFALALRARLA